jgi:N-acetyl-anhydromuramyl-L-alanine amidase AmpD
MKNMPAYTIRNDRLYIDGQPAPFVASPNAGGRIEPTLIVLHDTAGRLEPGSAVAWLADRRSKVSAHFVVERDGRVTQLVDCDRAAWHCGASSWQGRANCNGFAIGIEIVSPGRLKPSGGHGVAWFGQRWAAAECVAADSAAHGGPALWLPYTDAQVAAVGGLVRALAVGYPTITDVAGHFEISPRRKVDPGPQFDMSPLKALLASRAAPDPAQVAELQRRLAALKYFPGAIDGILGPRTRSALRDFQEQAGIEPHGRPDAATLAALAADDAKPAPTGARETITRRDLKASGSRTVRATQAVKRALESAAVTAAVAVPAVPDSAPDVLSGAGELVGKIEAAKGLGERVLALAGWVATAEGLVALGAAGLLAAAWGVLHLVEGWRVRDAQSGANVGR